MKMRNIWSEAFLRASTSPWRFIVLGVLFIRTPRLNLKLKANKQNWSRFLWASASCFPGQYPKFSRNDVTAYCKLLRNHASRHHWRKIKAKLFFLEWLNACVCALEPYSENLCCSFQDGSGFMGGNDFWFEMFIYIKRQQSGKSLLFQNCLFVSKRSE